MDGIFRQLAVAEAAESIVVEIIAMPFYATNSVGIVLSSGVEVVHAAFPLQAECQNKTVRSFSL
jgi:hypothetical protein